MKTVWVLVANRSDAKIYKIGGHADLILIKDFENPDARLKTKAFRNDAQGRLFNHFASYRHSAGNSHRENDDLLDQFVRKVSAHINESSHAGLFSHIVLVAEPKVLGGFRQEIGKHVQKNILAEIVYNRSALAETTDLYNLVKDRVPETAVL